VAKIVTSIRLTNTIPPSNKEYVVQIVDSGDGTYAVEAFNCAIGGNPKLQPKGNGLTLIDAQKTFQTLVNSKTRDGYKPDEKAKANAGVTVVVKERIATGLMPQLLNEITRVEALALIADPAYGLQTKEDGERLLARSLNGVLTAANKKGIATSIASDLATSLLALPGDFEIDGEIVANPTGGSTYHVFDIFSRDGVSHTQRAYRDRNAILGLLLADSAPNIQHARLYELTADKAAAFEEAERLEREGVVFKWLASAYRPGRPNSGGDQLKFKFWAELSAIVGGLSTGIDSVALELIDEGGARVSVGSAKANGKKLAVGDIVEVRYLYVKRRGGALVQPFLKALRTDVDAEECTTAQIKYRGDQALSA
jgi:bifunctional non-homologous end joining protein LigD